MALTQIFANQANTTLAGAITNTALTANLAPGSGVLFPSPGVGQYFTMIFNDVATNLSYEEVWVTNVTGDTITMIRAQEGSTAKAWDAGDIAFNGMTAGTANSFSQIASSQSNAFNYGIDIGSANAYIVSFTPAVTTATDGMPIWFKVKTSNTGASTLTLNGLSAIPLIGLSDAPLQGGELIANGTALAVYNAATSSAVLIACTGGASQVANATKSLHAINMATADARYAPINQAKIPGTYVFPAGSTAPTGSLVCPIAPTNISRTTYANLFAAIGTIWGAGDGSTTFGMPWFAADTPLVQANGNVGTTTAGAANAHLHAVSITSGTENAFHTHPVTDPEHEHVLELANNNNSNPGAGAPGFPLAGGDSTSPAPTGISLGAESTTHGHLVSGNTANSAGSANNMPAGTRSLICVWY
jgi:hypothetical protein